MDIGGASAPPTVNDTLVLKTQVATALTFDVEDLKHFSVTSTQTSRRRLSEPAPSPLSGRYSPQVLPEGSAGSRESRSADGARELAGRRLATYKWSVSFDAVVPLSDSGASDAQGFQDSVASTLAGPALAAALNAAFGATVDPASIATHRLTRKPTAVPSPVPTPFPVIAPTPAPITPYRPYRIKLEVLAFLGGLGLLACCVLSAGAWFFWKYRLKKEEQIIEEEFNFSPLKAENRFENRFGSRFNSDDQSAGSNRFLPSARYGSGPTTAYQNRFGQRNYSSGASSAMGGGAMPTRSALRTSSGRTVSGPQGSNPQSRGMSVRFPQSVQQGGARRSSRANSDPFYSNMGTAF